MGKPVIALSEKLRILNENKKAIDFLESLDFLHYHEVRTMQYPFMPEYFEPSFVCYAKVSEREEWLGHIPDLFRIYLDFNSNSFFLKSDFSEPEMKSFELTKDFLTCLKEKFQKKRDEYLLNKVKPVKKKHIDTTDLYLVRDTVFDTLKIGKSNNSKKRLASLQLSSSNKLELLYSVKGQGYKEKEIHEMFKGYRIVSEWFQNVPAIMEFFQDLINEEKCKNSQQ